MSDEGALQPLIKRTMASTQNPKEGAEIRTESEVSSGHKPADSATAFMSEPAPATPVKKDAALEPWKGISAVEMFWTLFSGLWFGFALQVRGNDCGLLTASWRSAERGPLTTRPPPARGT